MICQQISHLLGMDCHPLDDAGQVALISTPWKFKDGDSLPVFVEQAGNAVRFFDDGGVFMHFKGRGLNLSDARQTRFIKSAAEHHGATFTDSGEIELWTKPEEAPKGFAAFVSTLLALTQWESENSGISHDADVFVEEVAQCLIAWKKTEKLERRPKILGITGRTHELHFKIDGTLVLAASAHPNSISSVLHKLIDIKALPANQSIQTMVVLDDRYNPDAAKQEGLVLSGISSVIEMTRLQKNSGMPGTMH